MNTLLDEPDDRPDRPNRSADREITLGTTMILLIFFALAVYGAALFGFGYSLGSKHSESPVNTVAATETSSAGLTTAKPAPGSPLGAASSEKPPAATVTETVPLTPSDNAKSDPPPAPTHIPADAPNPEDSRPKSPPPATAPEAPAPLPVAGFGSVVVQVAAVSHQEDADLIASTLKRRGYAVNVRTEADKLLHVQVGPFATRKDAEAMKAKLLSDGFNAYIK